MKDGDKMEIHKMLTKAWNWLNSPIPDWAFATLLIIVAVGLIWTIAGYTYYWITGDFLLGFWRPFGYGGLSTSWDISSNHP